MIIQCIIYVLDEEEWDVTGFDELVKTPNNLLDDILVDMVELLKKLNLENKVLLEAVLQAIGQYFNNNLKSVFDPLLLSQSQGLGERLHVKGSHENFSQVMAISEIAKSSHKKHPICLLSSHENS